MLEQECFTLPNASFHTVDERKTVNLATAVINGFFAPFAVASNLLIVIVIVRNIALHTPSTILLGGLAVYDLMVGLVVQPCFVAFRVTETLHGSVPCGLRMLYSQSFWLCYGASFLTLSAISLERYVALHLHLRYKELVTSRRIIAVIVAICIVNVLLTSLEWLGPAHNYSSYVQTALWLSSLLSSCVAHVAAFRIMRRHQKHINATLKSLPTSPSLRHHRRQVKLAVSVAYIVGIYCAFNLPVMVVQIYVHWRNGLTSYDITSWTETIAFLNSSINPVICCWRNKDIRRGVFQILLNLCPCCVRPCCPCVAQFLSDEEKRRRSSCVATLQVPASADQPRP